MPDGPGPPATVLFSAGPTTLVPTMRRASIWRLAAVPAPTLATQRILFLRSGEGGERSGSCFAHKIATMSPWAPMTWDIGVPGG